MSAPSAIVKKTKGAKDKRSAHDAISYRRLGVALSNEGVPSTLNEVTRSVEVIGATENPVSTYDYEMGTVVSEVLLMSGCQLPESRQLPLLDNHNRWDTSGVIGSYRKMKVEGDNLVGQSIFSDTPEAQGPWQKVREGHLTDFSIGYKVVESVYVANAQRQIVGGKSFDGPVKVVTKWIPKELSVTPIGADEAAKARSEGVNAIKNEDGAVENTRMYAVATGSCNSCGSAACACGSCSKSDSCMVMPTGGGCCIDMGGLLCGCKDCGQYGDCTIGGRSEAANLKMEGRTMPEKVLSAPDETSIRAAAAKVEQARIYEIRAMCEQAGHQGLADELIRGDKSVDEARKAVFDKVISAAPTTGGMGYRAPVEIVKEERDKFRSAATDSIIIRSGRDIKAPFAGARELAGFSLRELARESLRLANQPAHGDPLAMIGRAFTSSDLPIILANVANKSLFEGYEASGETWQEWCGEGSVSDFKTHTSARPSELDDLDEIPEDGEYKHSAIKEGKEEYKIVTYGKLFKITRQAVINDDLGVLTETPRRQGESTSRKIGDCAYAVLIANSAMGDGVALFHANHGNVGTGGAPSEVTLAESIKLMKFQKDINGKRRLNIRPMFFIAPVSIEGAAEIFFNSGTFAGDNKAATRTNPYAGSRFVRIYEPRLDDNSATQWHLAGPKGKTVTVFFLNGNKAPYLEQKEGWNVDGVEYKVRIDAGAKAMDWKALTKNAGA